ncbi:MAG: recombinase family protein [Pseudomonadota bacterium]
MRKIGYARVSTIDQNLDLQIDALERAGCDEVFKDHGMSGATLDREGLGEAIAALEQGDMFVVWRLDRLARSMRELTDAVWTLHNRGIEFRSLCEHISVDSAFGEFTLHILSAVAHLERALIVERTREGMAAAKKRGVKFGRKPVLDVPACEEAISLVNCGMAVSDVAAHMGVSRSTIYRQMRRQVAA